jgi:hypothetical protein
MIKAIFRNGQIETEEPISFPEGTALKIELDDEADVEDDWDVSPEGIAAWIERNNADPVPSCSYEEFQANLKLLRQMDRDSMPEYFRKLEAKFNFLNDETDTQPSTAE